ncbi:glycine zipper 2TM domain-containing protein [Sulfuritalea sp.]|uniref:glycine zipper 2TM domain-containing protein n=1 Tax=Sulfuritalea sp. TaxID=2480090 RepID=UPI00286DA3C9|nr:glycine zipper 2TM domain-containing protein [Sulfuritalea sp.]
MNKYWLSVLFAPVVFSANAFAHDRDFDNRHERRHRHQVERVVVHQAYVQPRVVYQVPPQRIYHERVVYRGYPVYYEAAPVYREAPRHYPQPSHNGDRVVGQAIGAVAGAVIGSQFGHGDGRILSTAAGAVIGGVVGGNLSGYGD